MKKSQPLAPHADWKRIREAVTNCRKLSTLVNRAVHRIVPVDFSGPLVALNGEGARKRGGRWNPRKAEVSPKKIEEIPAKLLATGFPTAYVSEDFETAQAEAIHYIRKYFPPPNTRTIYLLNYRYSKANLTINEPIDLFNPKVLEALGYSSEELKADWLSHQDQGREALTQAIGRAAHHAGFDAIRYPSARRESGINIAVFPENASFHQDDDDEEEPKAVQFLDIEVTEIPGDVEISD